MKKEIGEEGREVHGKKREKEKKRRSGKKLAEAEKASIWGR